MDMWEYAKKLKKPEGKICLSLENRKIKKN